jgi:hypothetical protein
MPAEGFGRKIVKFGLAVQSEKGTVAATPTTVFPLPADDSIEYKTGNEVLNWGDGSAYAHEVLQRLESVDGGLNLPLIPGLTSAIADWCTTEDADKQGKWATLFFDFNSVLTVRYMDCKVGSAALSVVGHNTPTLSVTVAGLSKHASGVSLAATAATDTVPYKPSELAVQWESAGGGVAAAPQITKVDLTIDRKLESTEDGAGIVAQTMAYFKSNTGGMGVTGTIDRRMVDALMWADFIAGTLSALTLTFTRAETTTTTAAWTTAAAAITAWAEFTTW